MGEEEVFISVDRDGYKSNKKNVLDAKASLLKTLKSVHNLQVLERRRNDLKKQVRRLFLSIHKSLDNMELMMPSPTVPQKMVENEDDKESDEVKAAVEQEMSRRAEIENELLSIKEKLEVLNG